MNQKNIDQLFKNKLKNLQVSPDEKIWANVASKLRKKKRKVIPIWWLSGAVAAILLIGLFVLPTNEHQSIPNPTNIDEIITISPENEDQVVLQKKLPNDAIEVKKDNNQLLKTYVNLNKDSSKTTFKKHQNTLINIQQKEVHIVANQTFKALILNNINANLNTKKIDFTNFLKQQDSSLNKEKNDKKYWSIQPVFAVVNSNSFSNSSPISASLENSTTGENSFSYGIKMAYQINNKWALQSGIYYQEFRYNDQNISVFNSSSSTSSIQFNDLSTFAFHNSLQDGINISSINDLVTDEANLFQNFNYLEIPLELKYNFISAEKFKIDIVTGFSSLFLVSDSILLESPSILSKGEFTNLNNVNFSGNIGFDFTYDFTNNLSFNLNPMIKTQLNTFQNNSNGFKPYIIGIYSGIGFKFN